MATGAGRLGAVYGARQALRASCTRGISLLPALLYNTVLALVML